MDDWLTSLWITYNTTSGSYAVQIKEHKKNYKFK